jgi:hypothetical protein
MYMYGHIIQGLTLRTVHINAIELTVERSTKVD